MQATENNLTVREVMLETGIKARATLDKYIDMGVIRPIKKRGRQPESYRGRKFYFRAEAVQKLKKYMQTHGRIQPKGMEIKVKVKESRRSRKAVMTQDVSKQALLAQVDQAIQKVKYLEDVIKGLSKSLQELTTTH